MTSSVAAAAGAWLLVVWAGASWLEADSRRSVASLRRAARASVELPELVESLAGAARSGASMSGCLRAAVSADAARAPRAEAADRLEHGDGTVVAFDAWAASSPEPGVALVAAAAGMAAEAGGELHRALGGVAATLRERRALEREVRAFGAQARLSASVLAVAPVGVLAVGAVVDADLAGFLVGEPAGRACLAAGLALDAVSWRWMRWLAGSVSPRGRGTEASATLPELVDLLSVAAGVGLPVAGALAAAGPRSPEPWRSAIAAALDAAERGALLADALGALGRDVGPSAGPLVRVLTDALVDGDRLIAGLAGLAADARDLRRRTAEERARRLPVRMLGPLVCCSLPAFVLVALVPLLAGALAGLDTP